MLGKIIALIIMRKTKPAGNLLFQRLLGGMAAVLVLSLIASILLGVLILGSIYVSYEILVSNGMDPQSAAVSIGIVIFLMVVALVGAAVACMRRLRRVSKEIIAQEMPMAYRANNVANAFVDGLMKESRRA